MTPPTKIFQCVNGHHVCETCKSMKFYLPPNMILVDEPMEVNDHNANILFYRFRLVRPMCPKCRKRMGGRAVDMENFLKASYGFILSDTYISHIVDSGVHFLLDVLIS